MSAMNNTETPGTATVKHKQIANRSNIKYQGWDANGLKKFSDIAKLIKSQRSEQYRQQLEENYKITFKINSIVCMALLHLHQVKVQICTFSTEQNQSTNANLYIGESDNNQHDMINDDIENQMNVPMQEMVNDDDELINKYM